MGEPVADSEAPKVVDLKGKPVDVATETSPTIMEFIEALRSTAAGEKNLAVGFFLIDAQGRSWMNFRMEPGSLLDSVGAVTILKERIVRAYEAEQK